MLAQPITKCTIDGCERTHEARGMCHFHYRQWWEINRVSEPAPKPPCRIDGCPNLARAKGMCNPHYRRSLAGVPLANPLRVSKAVDSTLRKTWQNMIDRCTKENIYSWKAYGGRGIKVCERWQGSTGLRNFVTDMGPRPANPEGWTKNRPYYSIDRRDNDGDYSPENCHWGTAEEQRANKRQGGGRPRLNR